MYLNYFFNRFQPNDSILAFRTCGFINITMMYAYKMTYGFKESTFALIVGFSNMSFHLHT